jgi:hypothetical protein
MQRAEMKSDRIARLQRPADDIVILLMGINIRQLFKARMGIEL